MEKFGKFLGYAFCGIILITYIAFLFILPNAVDINKYKPLLVNIVKEQSKLDLDFESAKITTTPFLSAGVKINNVKIKLPDGSLIFSSDSIKTRISLPSILLMTVKVSCLEIEKPFINLEIAEDNEDYKIVKLIEDILNEKKEKTLGEDKVTETGRFNLKLIRIKVPNAKLKNYKILVTDTSTKHYLDLHGDILKAGYFNKKRASLKTNAELYSDETRKITANIDVNTFLPKRTPKLDSEDDPAERIDVKFINPVTMYRNYDLNAEIDTALRLNTHKDGKITAFGHFNIDGVTLKVSQLVLPESYIRVKAFGSSLNIDTNIYAAPEQNIQLLGSLNYGKHPNLNMNIKTGEIKFNDMILLAKAFLDSLNIKNELSQISASGTLISDCFIKTNFKKLKSDGFIKVVNGGLSVKNIGQIISNANINAILENSVLNFKDSSLYVDKSKVFVNGSIDEKSVADIEIMTEKLNLPILFKAFAPKKLRELYSFNSGDISLSVNLQGKLKQAVGAAEFNLENLNIGDRANNFVLKNSKLNGKFTCDSKTKDVLGNINNDNFGFSLLKTGSSVVIPKLEAEVSQNNIILSEHDMMFNDKSKIKYSGEITNYNKLEKIMFTAGGNIYTDDLIKLIGKDYSRYIDFNGTLPLKLNLDGNKKKQTLVVQILADKDNYITPAEFTEVGGKQTSMQAVVDLKPGRIKIKKTGLFTRSVTVDEDGNEIVKLDSIIDIDGTVARDRINLLKINIPKNLSGKLFVFPRSTFLVEKSRLFVFGEIKKPIIRGSIDIKEIDIPELLTNIENLNLNFRGHELDFNVKNAVLNGSDISLKGTANLIVDRILNISGFDVNSDLINLDKILTVAEKAQKYTPKTQNNASSSGAAAQIPVAVNSGSVDLKKFITGNIQIINTKSALTFLQNVLSLRELKTNIFNGRVSGRIDTDISNLAVNVNVTGENIDVRKALSDAAGVKDMLTGTAKFAAKLTIDASAKNMEAQLKGIQGNVKFQVLDGQFGPFGKIENLIIAENIRESQFFKTALGGVIDSLTSIDTTHFSELNGNLNFEEGICHIDPITSLGNILSLHVFGDFDLVKNYADMKVRARMASIVSQLLGPLNAINPINIMNSAASLNVVTAKAFSLFCEVVPAEEIEMLPNFANKYVDSGAAKFQLKVRGDASKPLRLVKSFKWLSSKTEYDDAVEFVNSLPEEIPGSTATNIEEAIAEAKALEAEKQTIKYKLKHIFDKEDKAKSVPAVNEDLQDENTQLIQEESDENTEINSQ